VISGPGRALLRDAAPVIVVAIAAVVGLGAVVSGARVLQTGAGAPPIGAWLVVVGLSVGPSLSIAIPCGAAAGGVAALARWCEEGAWTGLRASGRGGASLVASVLLIGALAGGGTAAVTLWVEPAARAAAARQLDDALAAFSPWPGRTTDLGELTVRAARVDGVLAEDVFFASDGVIGTARRAHPALGDDGPVVVLEDGVIAGPDWRATFRTWTRPIERPVPRVELAERTTADLARRAEQTARAGRDARYEWAVWWKRFFHPIAAFLAPLALLPLGAGRRPAVALGAAGLGYLVAVRTGDHLASALGPVASASAGPAWIAFLGVVGWATWRDR
jgi:lipopolysaccharide export LptBFGC system permease protein LptF